MIRAPKGPDWYDAVYASSEPYSRPVEEQGWFILWEAIAEKITDGSTVLDIGCGLGQLGHVLRTKRPNCEYIGLDFSPYAIEKAVSRNGGSHFEQVDLETVESLPVADAYVACEVLEHIENDVRLMSLVPTGSLIIITVPSHDSASHVRYFKSSNEAADRYKHLFHWWDIGSVGARHFMLSGVRR